MRMRSPRVDLLVLMLAQVSAACDAPDAAVPTLAAADGSSPDVRSGRPRRLGVLLFPGFEVLDVYGPLEMWGSVGREIEIVTIGKQAGPVASAQGPVTQAAFGYTAAPPLDLVLVPGGPGASKLLGDGDTLAFLRDRAPRAEILMSVCNGAALLAGAGLLDGRRATTNKAYWRKVTAVGPNVRWVPKARWVDDGAVVTSSGVSAGMDMSLHVIARLFGAKLAEEIAAGTEYAWHRDPAWDPFAAMNGLSDEPATH